MTSVYYVKLKTGEELFAEANLNEEIDWDALTGVLVNNAVIVNVDHATGETIARFWITYSNHRMSTIDLKDIYFFGLANETGTTFYHKFMESLNSKSDTMDLDDMSDDDLENAFTNGNASKMLH